MGVTRLSQQAIGEKAYELDEVLVSPTSWGWQAFPTSVVYDLKPTTRLGQIGIGVPSYKEDLGTPISVVITHADWGWQSFNVDLPAQNVLTTTGTWGWVPQEPVICSQYEAGYAYSFNGHVWPTCVFNDFVFGIRLSYDVAVQQKDWGWVANDPVVDYSDPILVDLQTGTWGWTGVSAAVSFQFEVQATTNSWGWLAYPATVALPNDVVLSVENWGWTAYPASISYENDIGLNIANWGWQSFAADVQAPTFDINLRWGTWGWQGLPATVRQTSLLQGDIDAIADAVWARFVAEGAVQQWLETWQRKGCDPDHPQTYSKRDMQIRVGSMVIDQTGDQTEITETRRP